VARAGPQASPPQARSHPSSRRCDRRRSLAHRPGAHRLARALRQGQALSEPRTMNGRGFWARIRQRWTANDREFLVARFDALERHMQSLRAAGNEELASVREQSRAALAASRLDLVRSVLPALDGLDEALRSGRQLLAPTADKEIR